MVTVEGLVVHPREGKGKSVGGTAVTAGELMDAGGGVESKCPRGTSDDGGGDGRCLCFGPLGSAVRVVGA